MAGDVLHLTRAASPQFIRPITVRVIRELVDRHPPYRWTWIEAYELAANGAAVARRELFLMPEGACRQTVPPPTPVRRPVRRGPTRAC
ncbi:hypothetical protein OG811_13485 [Micromonospora sp. NBC_01638]|nr:hypothetical protein OG811_13485 [Micromonospora sp. NBC_01638]